MCTAAAAARDTISAMRHFAWAAVILTLAMGVAAAQAPAPDADLATLIGRAGAYAGRFQQQFGSVVAEERYEQVSRPVPGSSGVGGAMVATTLRSDFLLVQMRPGEWMPFRDVFERDGKPVRDRQDRLAKLFLSGPTDDALARARDITNESSRYNVGNGTRTINIPTLPLMFLADDVRSGIRFTEAKRDESIAGRVVDFKEVARPTLIRTTNNRDLPATGRLWIDDVTGALLRGRVRAQDPAVDSEVTVTFQRDDSLGMWVPVRMDERFRRGRDATEIRGTATYTNFRRFQVSTSETLPSDLQGK
jgi:hypothetical protein